MSFSLGSGSEVFGMEVCATMEQTKAAQSKSVKSETFMIGCVAGYLPMVLLVGDLISSLAI
jgi:hypothetical protein